SGSRWPTTRASAPSTGVPTHASSASATRTSRPPAPRQPSILRSPRSVTPGAVLPTTHDDRPAGDASPLSSARRAAAYTTSIALSPAA
ncbi:hypothetical protein CF640_36850, partial [Burkholderia pseudomallei]